MVTYSAGGMEGEDWEGGYLVMLKALQRNSTVAAHLASNIVVYKHVFGALILIAKAPEALFSCLVCTYLSSLKIEWSG